MQASEPIQIFGKPYKSMSTGKGIADQDRNIISNQILILNFLRCAADLLQEGAIPTNRKFKDIPGTDSNDEGEEFEESIGQYSQIEKRGTILLTIKNAPPYTSWSVVGISIVYLY